MCFFSFITLIIPLLPYVNIAFFVENVVAALSLVPLLLEYVAAAVAFVLLLLENGSSDVALSLLLVMNVFVVLPPVLLLLENNSRSDDPEPHPPSRSRRSPRIPRCFILRDARRNVWQPDSRHRELRIETGTAGVVMRRTSADNEQKFNDRWEALAYDFAASQSLMRASARHLTNSKRIGLDLDESCWKPGEIVTICLEAFYELSAPRASDPLPSTSPLQNKQQQQSLPTSSDRARRVRVSSRKRAAMKKLKKQAKETKKNTPATPTSPPTRVSLFASYRARNVILLLIILLVIAGLHIHPGPTVNKKNSAAASEAAKALLAHRALLEERALASAEEQKAHVACLDYLFVEKQKTKVGNIFYARVMDHHVSPPMAREISVRITSKNTENFFTYFAPTVNSKGVATQKRASCPLYDNPEVLELNNNKRNVSNEFPVFPPRPAEVEADNRYTLLEIRRTQFEASNSHTLWRDVTESIGPLDHKQTLIDVLNDDSLSTYRTLETEHQKQLLVSLVRPIVENYEKIDGDNQLSRVQKMQQKLPILSRLHGVPRMHLRVLKGAVRQRLRNQHLAKQLSGCVLEQVTVVSPDRRRDPLADEEENRAQQMSPEDALDQRQCRTAKRHAQQGYIGRAANALMTTSTKATSALERARNSSEPNAEAKASRIKHEEDELAKKIEKLHPVNDNPDLKLPSGAYFDPTKNPDNLELTVTTTELKKTLQAACSGAAPGESGWTEELLYDLAIRDEVIARNLALIVRDIAMGQVSREFLDILCNCTLITLDKPNGGIRPIALCEAFLKIASRIALDRDSKALREKMPNQYGVAFSNGTDKIIHETRAFARDFVANGKAGVLTIDFSNAFNAPKRQKMWEMVRDFPHLRRIFAVEYSHASCLRNRQLRRNFFSRSGCRQGTTAGPALFCLTIQDMLNALNKIDGIRALAYMDDITILAQTAEAAGKAMECVLREGGKLSLEVNMKKCEYFTLVPKSQLPASLSALTPVKVLSRLLGATISVDDETEKQELNQRHEQSHEIFFRRIANCFGPYASAILASCGVPKINHILRTHAPSVTADLAQKFDEDVEAVVMGWMNAEVAKMTPEEINITRSFLHLPTSMGGMGFARAEHVAGPAYQASQVLTVSSKLRTKLQKAHCEPVNKRVADYIDACSALHKRHRDLNSRKGTASIFRDPKFKAEPAAWRMQMLWRTCARLHGIDDLALSCPGCKHDFPDHLQLMFHVGTCALISGQNATSAHYKVNRAISQWCLQAGLTVDSSEPRDMAHTTCPGCKAKVAADAWAAHKKGCDKCHSATPDPRIAGPDGRIWSIGSINPTADDSTPPAAIVYDYTQVGARQASHISRDDKSLFKAREKKKNDLYAEDAAKVRQELVTVASTEDGTFNNQGTRLIALLAEKTASDPNALRQYLQQRQQEAHGSSLANAFARGKFNNNVHHFPSSTRGRADRIKNIGVASSLVLNVVAKDVDGASSSSAAAAATPVVDPFPTSLSTFVRRRLREADTTGCEEFTSPARREYAPLLASTQSPVHASSKNIYTGNMHVSMSRYNDLLNGPSMEHNSDPSEPQMAFYAAVHIKLFLQQNPQYCFNSSSGNPRAFHVNRTHVIQSAVTAGIPERIAQQESFLANCRACLVFLNVIDRDNGLIMINNPTVLLNGTNFSASNNNRTLSVSSEVVSQAGNGASASYLGDTRVRQE